MIILIACVAAQAVTGEEFFSQIEQESLVIRAGPPAQLDSYLRAEQERWRRIVLENRADLSEVERTVIEHRFGLESVEAEKPMTLEQVGQIIGVTKERVRQIQNKAMEKIRLQLEAHFLGNKEALAQVAALTAALTQDGTPGASGANVVVTSHAATGVGSMGQPLLN